MKTYASIHRSLACIAFLSLASFCVAELIQTQVEDVIPAHYENQTVYVDDYGLVNETTTTWIEDYGYYDQAIYVQNWGDTYPDVTVPATYDGDGNVVTPEHTEPSTTPVYGITGGHWTTESTYGIIGGHNVETVTGQTWSIVGSHQETVSVWVDEVHTTHTVTVDNGDPPPSNNPPPTNNPPSTNNPLPTHNPPPTNNPPPINNSLVSSAGVNVLLAGDTSGSNHAMFTATQFEQSYATPENSMGDYANYGTKLSKNGIEVWSDIGLDQQATDSLIAKLKPAELVIEKKVPNAANATVATQGTRIAALDASFGGNVEVKGILRVNPAGDLDMGVFATGPRP